MIVLWVPNRKRLEGTTARSGKREMGDDADIPGVIGQMTRRRKSTT